MLAGGGGADNFQKLKDFLSQEKKEKNQNRIL